MDHAATEELGDGKEASTGNSCLHRLLRGLSPCSPPSPASRAPLLPWHRTWVLFLSVGTVLHSRSLELIHLAWLKLHAHGLLTPLLTLNHHQAILLFVLIFSRFFFCVDHLKSLYWLFCIIVSVLCFGYLAIRHMGVLAPQPGIELTPPALEGKVLTTGLPGKSPRLFLIQYLCKPMA